MEEKKINNYIVLMENLEKMLNETKRDDVKKYLKELYESFIIEMAKTEKKETNYYEQKLRNMNIDEKRIQEVIKKIDPSSAKKRDENIIKLDKNEEELKKYISENVINSTNTVIKNRYKKIVEKLKEDFENPNELAINTWLKNYIEFVNFYKGYLDKNYMIENIRVLFKEYDKEEKYIVNLQDNLSKIMREIVEAEIKEEKPIKEVHSDINSRALEIKNIKKMHMQENTQKTLNLMTITSKNNKWGPKSIISYIIYKLFKNKKLTNEKFISLMQQNGYFVNDSNELIDIDGNIIDDDVIEKDRASYLKHKLIEYHTDGEIPHSYKKNKITSMLLNMKISQSIKNKYKKQSKQDVKNSDNIDIIKGMGKC